MYAYFKLKLLYNRKSTLIQKTARRLLSEQQSKETISHRTRSNPQPRGHQESNYEELENAKYPNQSFYKTPQ